MRGSVIKRGKTWTYVLALGRDPVTRRKRQKWVGGFATKSAAEGLWWRRSAACGGASTSTPGR